MTTVVACHQPNFLPWLGFFAKLAKADIVVLLDDVQFTQGAGRDNWTTRVRIMGSNGPIWLSVPVLRSGQGRQLIRDLRADEPAKWLPRLLRTVNEAYAKTRAAQHILPPILDLISATSVNICETNLALIKHIHGLLNLPSRLVCSSSLGVTSESTDRLIELTRACGGSVYLSGDGASGYQENELFAAAGIDLRKLGFRSPTYPQRGSGEFVPGLSIVDALCNVGVEETRVMLGLTGEKN